MWETSGSQAVEVLIEETKTVFDGDDDDSDDDFPLGSFVERVEG
jgi:hypothetical protein